MKNRFYTYEVVYGVACLSFQARNTGQCSELTHNTQGTTWTGGTPRMILENYYVPLYPMFTDVRTYE